METGHVIAVILTLAIFDFIYTFIKDLLLMSTSYFSYYLSNSDKYFFSRNNISLFYMIKQLERQEYNISKQNVC